MKPTDEVKQNHSQATLKSGELSDSELENVVGAGTADSTQLTEAPEAGENFTINWTNPGQGRDKIIIRKSPTTF